MVRKKMRELNLDLGRSLQKDLCLACHERLQQLITRTHVLRAVTPKGYKKLVTLIEDNVCDSCRLKIWRMGAEQGRKEEVKP